MPELIGQILTERYRVDTFLGRGGMAEVYKVWDNHRMTYLAMKVLHQDLAVDRVFMRRFQREAQTLEKLQHPNIVRFYGLERDGRLAFMLLDYIEGENLKPKIFDAEGPYPLDGVRTVMRAICGALAYAHREGHIHCDIKPGNIMIDEHGKVLLSDFGIARMSDAATATMVGLGTPAYMAPEQARGLDPLPQTDIYALGIVLFEMLTGGERPFTGEQSWTTGSTSEKVRWEQINLPPPSPRRWNPDISDELEAVVLKSLAKDPAERYASPLDLLNALEMALTVDESPDDAETLIAEPPSGGDSIMVSEVPDGQYEPEESDDSDVAEGGALADEQKVDPPVVDKPRRRGVVLVLIGLGVAAIIVGGGMFMMGRGGTGPLAMLAAATDTPTATATATPLPTETPEETPTPLPTETAVPASITPSSTWTLTFTPSQTPTDTATIPPTDTPTVTQTLTPSSLPEGYAIVPDVTGLDFYSAGLKLQEAGFEVEKVSEYNPTVDKNEVFHQTPEAGASLEKSSLVHVTYASDVQQMMRVSPDGIYFDKETYIDIPKDTWCRLSMSMFEPLEGNVPRVLIDIIGPDGKKIVDLYYKSAQDKEFTTTTFGSHTIIIYTSHVSTEIQLSCKPPYNPNAFEDGEVNVPDVVEMRYDEALSILKSLKINPVIVWVLMNDLEHDLASNVERGTVIAQSVSAAETIEVNSTIEIKAVGSFQHTYSQDGSNSYFFELLAGREYTIGFSSVCIPDRSQGYRYSIFDSSGNLVDSYRFVDYYTAKWGQREFGELSEFVPTVSGTYKIFISYSDDQDCGFTVSIKSK